MRTFATAGAVMLIAPLWAQNLIPNGSFEEYSECPPYFGYSFLATGWGGPGGVGYNSPDYFNACHSSNVVGVPASQFGYQFAADGQGYMGMITSESDPAYREFIGAQLLEPLTTGVPICLSFRMAVGGFGSFTGNSPFNTCRNFGLKFFVQPPTDWGDYLYPNSAALRMEELPTDTAVWYFLSDVYVPDSDYVYVVLGNFYADSLSDITLLDSTGFGTEQSYAFVDDVRVSFDLNYCTTGMRSTVREPIHIWPQPVGDDLIISGNAEIKGPISYVIRTVEGQDVMVGRQVVIDGTCLLNVAGLRNAVYVLHITNAKNETWTARFIHLTP